MWKSAARFGKALEGLTKTVGPIVAALWIGWQYHQSQGDKRVEATLGYVTRYENSETSVGKAQRALATSLWNHANEISELRTTRATAQDLETVRITIVKRVISAADAASTPLRPLDELDDFYSALATCVRGHVCDEDAALRFFGCAATDLLQDFGTAMIDRDRLASRYGWGVRWIAAGSAQAKSCPA